MVFNATEMAWDMLLQVLRGMFIPGDGIRKGSRGNAVIMLTTNRPKPPDTPTPEAIAAAHAEANAELHAWARRVYRQQRQLIQSLKTGVSTPKPGKPGWLLRTLKELERVPADKVRYETRYQGVTRARSGCKRVPGFDATLPGTARRGPKKLGLFMDEEDAGRAVLAAMLAEHQEQETKIVNGEEVAS